MHNLDVSSTNSGQAGTGCIAALGVEGEDRGALVRLADTEPQPNQHVV
jgi:hypothetical protein